MCFLTLLSFIFFANSTVAMSPDEEVSGELVVTSGECDDCFVELEPVDDITLSVDGELRLNRIIIRDKTVGYGDTHWLTLRGSEMDLSLDYQNKVALVASAYVDHIFQYTDTNNIDWNKKFKFEYFLKEFYVKVFQDFQGHPVVFMAGKHDVALGLQRLSDIMPIGRNHIEGFQDQFGVIGATFDISLEQATQILDGARISLYETGESDLDIEKGSLGIAIRLDKRVGNAEFVASVLQQKNKNLPFAEGIERRVVTAVKLDVTDRFSIFWEGHLYDNNPWLGKGQKLNDSKHAMTLAFEAEVLENSTLLGHVTHTDELSTTFGLGWTYDLYETRNTKTKVGFELAHTVYSDFLKRTHNWKPDTWYGATVQVNFQTPR